MCEGYDAAQICMNGHLIASTAGSSPQFRQPFCDKCGEATLMNCPACDAAIRGHYHSPGFIGGFNYDRPAFCYNCGKPYPWTERAISAAAQLAADDESLSEEEAAAFEKDLGEIARETPQAKASAGRIRKLLGKMASGTATAIREIIVDVASEAVKKTLWPEP
jgi:hypothetical protein